MVCSRANELISEYIDEVLDDEIKLELEAHFRECSLCKQRLEEQKAIIKRLNSVEPVKPPEDFLSQVHSRIERRAEFENLMKKAFFPGKKKMSVEAVGVLVSVVLVIMAYKYIQKDFSLYPDQPVEIQAVAKKKEIIRYSADELGGSGESIAVLPSSISVQNYVSSSSDVTSSRTGSEAQQAWGSDNLYEQSSNPVMEKESQGLAKSRSLEQEDKRSIVYTPVQPSQTIQGMPEGIIPNRAGITNETVAFEKKALVKETQELYITDTSLNNDSGELISTSRRLGSIDETLGSGKVESDSKNIKSGQVITKTEHLAAQEKLDYQNSVTTLSVKKSVPESTVGGSVVEPKDLVDLRIDTGRLAMDKVYSDMIKFISGVGGSVIRSEYDKDGTMKSFIVRIPAENLPKLKNYLQTVENISKNDIEVISTSSY